MVDENFLMNTIMKSGSSYQISSARTNKAPPSGGIFCKKIPLTRKWSIIEVKVMINTIWHSEFKLTYGHFES